MMDPERKSRMAAIRADQMKREDGWEPAGESSSAQLCNNIPNIPNYIDEQWGMDKGVSK
ncbi:MAG TPA: hypothetical protein VK543_02770 [Puia sp.]|nr:hypothetical protein [Puia sp.]